MAAVQDRTRAVNGLNDPQQGACSGPEAPAHAPCSAGCWRIWRRWMTGCGRWSMMHELGPLALRQLELLIMRAPPGLQFVLATRHDVRLRADVEAEQDRRVAGIRLAEAAHSQPSHPYTKVCGRPLADDITARRPIARRMAPPGNCFSASGRNPRGNRAITGRSCTMSPI